jgi:hypothetical protein
MNGQITVQAWLTLRKTSVGIRIAKTTTERPQLQPNETAVKIKLLVPTNIVDAAPAIAATITENDLAKPDIQAQIEPQETTTALADNIMDDDAD